MGDWRLLMNTLLCGFAVAADIMCSACLASDQSAPVLHLSANYWAPYTGEALAQQGVASEIVVTALRRAGYRASISFMPWSRALTSTYRGLSDGVVAVWSTQQRRARLVYSDSYLSNRMFLFYAKAGRCNDGLSTGTRIGVGRNYEYSDNFLAQYSQLLKPVDRLEQNLLKLQVGRVDFVLEDPLIVHHALQHGPKGFDQPPPQQCAGKPLLTLPLHFGLRRDFPNAAAIVAAFNLQLKAMKKDGTLDAALRRLAEGNHG